MDAAASPSPNALTGGVVHTAPLPGPPIGMGQANLPYPANSGVGQAAAGGFPGAPDYSALDQYIGSQRGRIGSEYDQMMRDLTQREQGGMGNINALPGQVRDLYGGAQHAFDAYANQMIGTQGASGLQPIGNEGWRAPIVGAMQMGSAAMQAQAPFLRQGLGEEMTQARGMAGATRDELLNALDQQAMEMKQHGIDASYQNAVDAYNAKKQMSPLEEYEAKKQIDQQYPSSSSSKSKVDPKSFSPLDVSSDRAKAISPHKRAELQGSDTYKETVGEINDALSQGQSKAEIRGLILQNIKTPTDAMIASILMAQGLI